VKKAFADRNPNATKAFLDGIFEASDFISKNPDEAANVLMELTELPKGEQLSVLKDIQWHGRDEQRQLMVSPGSFAKGMQQLADLLVKYKQIDQAPKVNDWLKPSLVP
jgi:taurine transport system substrate-binding protein